MSDVTSNPSSEKPAAYRVLARKYRPKDFSDLMVGQEPMVRTLTNAFETGRIAQAYMLTGVRGVGKTTTLRMLAGFETPSDGTITIGGRDVTNVPVNARNVGMVFQSYALFPHMSVR